MRKSDKQACGHRKQKSTNACTSDPPLTISHNTMHTKKNRHAEEFSMKPLLKRLVYGVIHQCSVLFLFPLPLNSVATSRTVKAVLIREQGF